MLNTLINQLRNSSASKHFLIVASTHFGTLALGAGTSIIIARTLGPSGRGEISKILLWTSFLISMGNLGIPEALIYYLSREKDRHIRGQWIASAWAIMLPLGFMWIVVGWYIIPLLLRDASEQMILAARLALVILPFSYLGQVNRGLQGLKQFTRWAIFRLLIPISYLSILIILLLFKQLDVYTAVMAQMIANVVSPFYVLSTIKHLGLRIRLPSWHQIRQLSSFGFRSILGQIPQTFNLQLDQLLIAIFMTDKELGLYVIAVTWSTLSRSVFLAVGTVLFPYLSSTEGKEAQMVLLTKVIRYSIFLSFVTMLILLLATPIAIPLVFGPDFADSIPVAMILVIAALFNNANSILSNGVRGMGTPQATAYAEASSLIITILFLYPLLSLFGIIGAALVSLVAYSIATTILLIYIVSQHKAQLTDLLILNRDDIKSALKLI